METGNIALVSYLSGPLARFLDSLRLELTPDSRPRAHVTILSPRQLTIPVDSIMERIEEVCSGCPPFEAKLGDVQIFPGSNVLYVDLIRGGEHLCALHERLNTGILTSESGYSYHPHATVAQGLEADEARRLLPHARRLWAEFPGSRRFEIDALSLVREDSYQRWSDLVRIPIAEPVFIR